jgi:hypothetical protein
LTNSDLTYTRNLERETKLCYVLPPLGKLLEDLEIETKLFLFPSNSSIWNGCAADTRAYMRTLRGGMPKLILMSSYFAKLLKINFSCFAKIKWEQTVRVALIRVERLERRWTGRVRGLGVGMATELSPRESLIPLPERAE